MFNLGSFLSKDACRFCRSFQELSVSGVLFHPCPLLLNLFCKLLADPNSNEYLVCTWKNRLPYRREQVTERLPKSRQTVRDIELDLARPSDRLIVNPSRQAASAQLLQPKRPLLAPHGENCGKSHVEKNVTAKARAAARLYLRGRTEARRRETFKLCTSR